MEGEETPWQALGPALLRDWEELLDAGGYNPSLSPGWTAVAAEAFGVLGDLRALVLRDAGRLVGVVPFFVRETRMWGVPIKLVELAGNLVAYHQEIVAPGHEAEAIHRLIDRVGGRNCVVRAANVVEGGATDVALRGVGPAGLGSVLSYPGEVSPFLPVGSSWEEFLQSRGKKFRYKVRKVEQELTRGGDMALRWFERSDQVPELREAILRIEARSWKAGAGMDIGGRAVERAYYECLLPWLADRGMLVANVLYVADLPVAYSLACRHQGWVGQLKTSFDDAYADRWPGRTVMAAIVRRTFEDGGKEFDFLGDRMPHKMEWTTACRPHFAHFLFSGGLRAASVARAKQAVAAARGWWARRRRESVADPGAGKQPG